jgi:hypothetical protein
MCIELFNAVDIDLPERCERAVQGVDALSRIEGLLSSRAPSSEGTLAPVRRRIVAPNGFQKVQKIRS